MRDEYWLTPSERDVYAVEWNDPRPSPGDVADLIGHARVADAVMRELAEALRSLMPCSCGWCDHGPDERCPASMTLARYDRLTGGNDE
jgi:hypothetical protein